MDAKKQKGLRDAGWSIGSAEDFLFAHFKETKDRVSDLIEREKTKGVSDAEKEDFPQEKLPPKNERICSAETCQTK